MQARTGDHSELLESFYLFRKANPADLAVLTRRVQRVHCRSRELIFRENEAADSMYLIELGTVEIFRSDGAVPLFTVGSGGGFGEIAFFDPGTRPASARAVEPCHLVQIPFAGLSDVLPAQPALALVVFQNASAFLARRLRRSLHDLACAQAVRLH